MSKTPTLKVPDPAGKKWYSLWLHLPDGTKKEVTFDAFDEVAGRDRYTRGSGYVDHVPNPYYVQKWCQENDVTLDSLSEELLVGRWVLERRADGVVRTCDSMCCPLSQRWEDWE